ncbi:hypothetical protein RQP46_000121 [Phenoliferia psychrophenolica]
MVALQEEAWLAREGEDTPAKRKAARSATGDGLATVALVCKELNQLAAQFLFQAVNVARMLAPIFLHSISQRHSHLITTVNLSSLPDFPSTIHLSLYDFVLHFLHSFPNLHSLALQVVVARILFGTTWLATGEPEQSSPSALRIDALRNAARSVRNLTLEGFSPSEAASILKLWTDLRQLRLLDNKSDGSAETRTTGKNSMSPLVPSLVRLKGLEYLQIGELGDDDDPDAQPHWPDDALATLALHPPPLVSLKLSSSVFHFSTFAFITSFHSTLRHLSITTAIVETATEDVPTPASFRVQLPHLSSLLIRNDNGSDTSEQVLLPFLQCPVTNLTIIDDHLEHRDILKLLQNQIPALRLLSFKAAYLPFPLDGHLVLRRVCADRGLPPPTHSFFDEPHFIGDVDKEEVELVSSELDAILEFGKGQVEWGRRLGDVSIAAALVEALRPLNEFKKAWAD